MSEFVLGTLSGISTFLIAVLLFVSNLFWSVASALLSQRRGRSSLNWFFLTCVYGMYALILLACSRTLGHGESDTMSKVLWIVFAVSVVITVTVGVALLSIATGI